MSLLSSLLASSSSVPKDAYFRNVTLLLHGDGSNGAQNNTFLDSSSNNFTITRNGNTTQGSFSPYGTRWSNYFDGSGDYLTVPDSSSWAFDADFTIEGWAYPTSASGEQTIASQWYGGTISQTAWLLQFNNGNAKAIIAIGGTQYPITSSATYPTNTWHHLALCRSGSTLTLYVNGVSVGSATASGTTNDIAYPVYVGAINNMNSITARFNGYISNLRIVKGTAVYTAAFTPPTAPLTAITNTSLLTCQSNRFRDASTNNFAITKFGETSVTVFSPFTLGFPGYAPATYGGSGFFNGSTDYLTVPANAAFSLGSGDFTLECWVYNREVSRNVGYAGVWSSSYILYRESTVYRFYYGGPAGSPLTSSIPAIANAWTHLAVVRNGSTLTFYVNGAVGATTNVGTTAFVNGSTQPFHIATNQDGPTSYAVDGYMAGLRLVKGTAIYTAAFTPPTTPPTAVTGTALLCNFTNAGIFDASMQNNMETAGNAQVSTTQVKYGATSTYFDGTDDWLSTPNKPEHNFGTRDFTIEAWVYPTGTNPQATIVSNYNGPSNGFGLLLGSTGPLFGWGDTNLLTGSSAFSQNAWSHIAVTRAGTSLRMFLNGTQIASATNSTNFTTSGALHIGRLRTATAAFFWQGYIDDLRITRGFARYTANFTPPTAAFPDQ